MDIAIVILLIIMSGLFSGLTIGLMGLSYTEVKRASDLGSSDATKVLSLIEHSNLLLVTLLLGNTAVNSALSIFLSSLVGTGIIAGITATGLILVFGEVLPASLLSKHALRVGAIMAPVVNALMFILWVFTKPIATLLDKYVGVVKDTFFNRAEFIHIAQVHEASNQSDIDDLDRRSIVGALTLTNKLVSEHMTREVFSLKSGTVINSILIDKIKFNGFSRIPIMSEDNTVKGILLVKKLLNFKNSDKAVTVDNYMEITPVFTVNANAKLDNVLGYMTKNGIHMAEVKAFDSVVGIITMEDILEELLQIEITDETDRPKDI